MHSRPRAADDTFHNHPLQAIRSNCSQLLPRIKPRLRQESGTPRRGAMAQSVTRRRHRPLANALLQVNGEMREALCWKQAMQQNHISSSLLCRRISIQWVRTD
jgi:hypothetical protein